MGKDLFGFYYSKKYVSEEDGDLLDQIKEDLGLNNLLIKKLTIVADGETGLDINNLGVYSEMFQSPDGNYYLSLDGNDVLVNSVKTDTASVNCFVAIIFSK